MKGTSCVILVLTNASLAPATLHAGTYRGVVRMFTCDPSLFLFVVGCLRIAISCVRRKGIISEYGNTPFPRVRALH